MLEEDPVARVEPDEVEPLELLVADARAEDQRVDAVAGAGDKTVATVTFEDSGAQKRLLLRYAPLTKVED